MGNMLILFEIFSFATSESLLVSIPETAGLLVFGVGLAILAILMRSFLARGEKDKTDESVTKKA